MKTLGRRVSMKKRFILTAVLSLAAIAVVSIGIVFAWFLARTNTQPIDFSTDGIVFSYKINDDKENVSSYDVTNVVFFDADSTSEGEFFYDMACVVKVEYENVCNAKIDINLTFNPLQEETGAHLDALITGEEITKAQTEGLDTVDSIVSALAQEDHTNRTFTLSQLEKGDKGVIYVYLYGVQPVDNSNNDFFADDYGFSLTAVAIKGGA